jgi:hypothetical protein
MIMITPAACMMLPEQLVHQMAYAFEHSDTGSMASGNRTQGESRKDQRHDEQAKDERDVGRDLSCDRDEGPSKQ